MPPMCLSGVLAVASIVLHHQSSTSTSTSQGDINAQARTLIVQSRTLPASDIRILRDAALQAMNNRYFSGGITRATMNGAPKSFDHPHDKEEFELDNRGLLRFRRITHPERGVFQLERVVLHEYTGLPAVRCSDRSVRPGKKLSISYSQDRGKWYVTPSITLGEGTYPSSNTLFNFLFKPDVELSDAGLRDGAGGRERGLLARRGVQEDVVWLDVESLLLQRVVC